MQFGWRCIPTCLPGQDLMSPCILRPPVPFNGIQASGLLCEASAAAWIAAKIEYLRSPKPPLSIRLNRARRPGQRAWD